jgi:hypothetical protein
MRPDLSMSRSNLEDHDYAARFVLDFLVARHPTLLSIDELVREFAGSSDDHDGARVLVHDGLAELASWGLVNRVGDFVFASRSTVRCRELSL